MSTIISPIINVSELFDIYQNKNVIIVDVSNDKNAKSNYEKQHLKGAIFVDLNTQLAQIEENAAIGGRHPLPSISNFIKTLSALGISSNSRIVIYDNANGSNAAARFWWMLKAIGYDKVQVLNGGFQEALAHGFFIESIPTSLKQSELSFDEDWKLPTVSMNQVEIARDSKAHLIIDVRSSERFLGISEPIDLIAGHIPNAINIPFTENLDKKGLFLSPDLLKRKYKNLFEEYTSENIIVHCGSGVTACHTILAMAYANLPIPSLYVGSWSEWSRNN